MTKETQRKIRVERLEAGRADDKNTVAFKTSEMMPFLMLGLDLPPPPLFKDVMEKNIIPQVCLPLQLFTN